jgi:hypothetical protein
MNHHREFLLHAVLVNGEVATLSDDKDLANRLGAQDVDVGMVGTRPRRSPGGLIPNASLLRATCKP